MAALPGLVNAAREPHEMFATSWGAWLAADDWNSLARSYPRYTAFMEAAQKVVPQVLDASLFKLAAVEQVARASMQGPVVEQVLEKGLMSVDGGSLTAPAHPDHRLRTLLTIAAEPWSGIADEILERSVAADIAVVDVGRHRARRGVGASLVRSVRSGNRRSTRRRSRAMTLRDESRRAARSWDAKIALLAPELERSIVATYIGAAPLEPEEPLVVEMVDGELIARPVGRLDSDDPISSSEELALSMQMLADRSDL
jgi:hypothetical protein